MLRQKLWNVFFRIAENPYPLRNESKLKSYNNHMIRNEIETTSFVRPRIWNSILPEFKANSRLKSGVWPQKTALVNFTKAMFSL